MENLLTNPFVLLVIDALAWGAPFWPEAAVGVAAALSGVLLALRLRSKPAPEIEKPAPVAKPKAAGTRDIYDEAIEEAEAEKSARRPGGEEAVKVVIPDAPPPAPVAAEEEEFEEEFEEEEELETPPVEAEARAVEEAPVREEPIIDEAPPTEDFVSRLKRGLKKTQEGFLGKIDSLIRGAKKLDEDVFEEMEEALVTADMGVETAYRLLETIQKEGARGALKNPEAARDLLKANIMRILAKVDKPLAIDSRKPFVIMVLGVNGVGKTTTIAKLAYRYVKEGRKVLLAAGDTFRAAAAEQLGVWAKRVGADFVRHAEGADPSAVAFDAVQAAKARGVDIVIVDTAGRLHTRVPLMDELKKVKRVLGREIEGAPHEALLVLDSNTGQNAISQTQAFNEAVGVTGLVMTKLDGTAKGGIVVGISDKFGIPIRFIGIGEKMYDLAEFKAEPFVEALFS